MRLAARRERNARNFEFGIRNFGAEPARGNSKEIFNFELGIMEESTLIINIFKFQP